MPAEWVTGAKAVLRKDPTADPLGYRVLTSYPEPPRKTLPTF